MLAGYTSALLMGLTLGLLGAGGSILTVPILVYLFGVDPILATAYSLFVVGATALVGSIGYARQGLIDLRAAVLFGFPSVASVFAVRLWVIPNLPEQILGLPRGGFVLIVFALVMLAAAFTMIRPKPKRSSIQPSKPRSRVALICLEGVLVGGITGFVGAGGGFLIVPALIYFLGLPIRRAIGTSLIVIAAKSLIGFCADLTAAQAIDWKLLLAFTALSSVGIGAGVLLGAKISPERLKVAFGWFVLITGIAIVLVEIS